MGVLGVVPDGWHPIGFIVGVLMVDRQSSGGCRIGYFFFWTDLRGPIACSLLGGAIPTQNSGYGVTRLCPS